MAAATRCPIWNTPALGTSGSLVEGSSRVWSARAGGEYRYSLDLHSDWGRNFSNRQRAIVTNWLVDQRRLGVTSPLITSEVVNALLRDGRPLRFSEKRERFWRATQQMDLKPGDTLSYEIEYSADDERDLARLWAAIGVESDDEGFAIIGTLRDEGLLYLHNGEITFSGPAFEKFEGMSQQTGHQAFVAMWFDPSMKEAWRFGFAPAIRDAGYDPFRIDGLQHNGKIDDAIVAEIKKSRFLIADFTCGGIQTEDGFQPNPRGGVYYEAGLAHGLGMEVIFTCREDRMQWLHFDTRQFAHIVWQEPGDLREQLYNRIAATLKEAPGAPGRGNGSVDP